MKYRTVVKDPAYNDIRGILIYFRDDVENELAGVKIVAKIYQQIDKIAIFPLGCEVIKCKGTHKIRSVRSGRYRIFYVVDEQKREVHVLRVLHAHHSFESQL